MELPHVGQHCGLASCNQLDFLPYTCRHCTKVFCHEHWKPGEHRCPDYNEFENDRRVPVCPVCGKPIPVNKGEDPNLRVDRHIAAGCADVGTSTSAPAYTNSCSFKGCKTNSLVPVRCDECGKSFCLKHRHPLDHKCAYAVGSNPNSRTSSPTPTRPPASQQGRIGRPGLAAMLRQRQQQGQKPAPGSSAGGKTKSPVRAISLPAS